MVKLSKSERNLRDLLSGVVYQTMRQVQTAFKAAYGYEVSSWYIYHVMSDSHTNTGKYEGIFPYLSYEQRFTFEPTDGTLADFKAQVRKTGLNINDKHAITRLLGTNNEAMIIAGKISNPIIQVEIQKFIRVVESANIFLEDALKKEFA